MDKNSNFKLTEPIILTFEKEKEDSHLLKKYRRNKNFTIVYKKYILFIFFSIALFISLFYLINWHVENQKNSKLIQTVEQYINTNSSSVEPDTYNGFLSIDFDGLKSINNSCFGWIVINNTDISYPIVKYTNNEYYLNHSFDQSRNSAGWIYADYRNFCDGFDKNLIIYGHNRRDGTMFSPINEICLNEEWYKNEENQIIKLYTETETFFYQIISIYTIKPENYYTTTSFLSDSVYEDFINKIKSRSLYNFRIETSSSDHILTLSTCSNNNSKRTVIHAKKIDALQ